MNKKQIKELQLEIMIALVEVRVHNGYCVKDFFFIPRQGYDWKNICLVFQEQMEVYKEVTGCTYQDIYPTQYQDYQLLLTTI